MIDRNHLTIDVSDSRLNKLILIQLGKGDRPPEIMRGMPKAQKNDRHAFFTSY